MWRLRDKRQLFVWNFVCCIAAGTVAMTIGIIFFLSTRTPVTHAAETEELYRNAHTYYVRYGKDMVFVPTNERDGMIYYATSGKKSTSKTRYNTIGWQVTIRNEQGQLLQTIYYKTGGAYMKKVDDRIVDGYNYNLYGISLENLRSRMKPAVLEELERANCSITFDACTVVLLNDVPQGGMSDDGIEWGTVYTTYEGISNAKGWAAATKEAMKSYFEKKVEGLFSKVVLVAGTGITRTEGTGEYCYGTRIRIIADVKPGYHFTGWSGDISGKSRICYFYVNSNMTIYANADTNAVPEIKANDAYVSLRDVQAGKVTEEWLSQFAVATDKEDGRIPYGKREGNSFYVIDYNEREIRSMQTFGSFTQLFYAVDTNGNQVYKQITVTVFDEEEAKRRSSFSIRFFGAPFWREDSGEWVPEDRGGLLTDSIWKEEPSYRLLLDRLYR